MTDRSKAPRNPNALPLSMAVTGSRTPLVRQDRWVQSRRCPRTHIRPGQITASEGCHLDGPSSAVSAASVFHSSCGPAHAGFSTLLAWPGGLQCGSVSAGRDCLGSPDFGGALSRNQARAHRRLLGPAGAVLQNHHLPTLRIDPAIGRHFSQSRLRRGGRAPPRLLCGMLSPTVIREPVAPA